MQSLVTNLLGALGTVVVGASADIRRLQRTLESISAILGDADRRMQDETIKLWSKKLKEVLYDADDLMDRYKAVEPQAPVCRQRISTLTCFGTVARPRPHGVGISIREINCRLERIAKDGAKYRLRPSHRTTQQSLIHSQVSSIVAHNILGVEGDMRVLARVLLDPIKPGNQALAIAGMGGIGKTTLAHKIYNYPEIKQHFSVRIWVLVSQHFKETDLLREILNGAGYRCDAEVTRQTLEEILSGVIQGRRFLIVLDDVWNADVWEDVLKKPLQSGDLASRVVITTRDAEIAKQIGALPIHHVRPLGLQDSWSLLRKTASVGDNEGEMEWLSDVGMEIVHKCEGVPLALKSVGGILRTKELSKREWSKVLEHLTTYKDGFLVPALYLSYQALDPTTKPCFLYCSLLPQNILVARRDLMQMWISEGFVERHPCEGTAEDLAEAYYDKIAATDLLQLESDGIERDRGCKIHDLIRDLAIKLAQDDNYSGDISQLGNTRTKVRRLSIGSRVTIQSLDVITNHKWLRSLLMFNNPVPNNMLMDLLDQLRHLRVLDLRGSVIQEVPSSLGMLFHLRYLNLSHTTIRNLPDSIKDLKNLLFLNLHGCMHLDKLPNGITQLHNLRSLDILHTDLDDMPSGVRGMKYLNSFLGFVPGNCGLDELKDLEQMRYLEIRKLDRAARVGADLQNKKYLKSLVLSWEEDAAHAIDPDEIEDILEDLQPSASLEELTIECYFGHAYPRWMSFTASYPNLVYLNLKSCIFSKSLPPLGQLPKLKNLCISASKGIVTIGTEFFGHTGLSFPKLEMLVMKEMDNLEEWWEPSDGRAFPVLRELHLEKCPKLMSLPQCLQFSKILTKLAIEAADNIRVIEDLFYVTELRIKDCPNMERISSLNELKTLEIIRCPILQDVGDVEALQHLMLEDFALESLPGWLAPNNMNLRTFEITGNHDLLKSLEMDSPNRRMIATIPHVYVHSTGKSRSNFFFSTAKRNTSASLPSSQHAADLRAPKLPKDVTLKPLPKRLAPNEMMNLQTLEITGTHDQSKMPKRVEMDFLEEPEIDSIRLTNPRSRSHIPKFGNWEAGAAPYTAYFDNARKGKTSPIQGSPVRTVMNPENSKLKHGQRPNREDERSPLHPNYNAKSASKPGVALSSRERKGSTEGDGQASNTPGRTRMRPGGRDDDLSEKGASVPRFGEWNESNDGDSYTDIFTIVREEKQTGATKVSSNVQHHNPDNTESVSCGCFSFGKN